jgi:hypothetical protein
MSPVLQKQNFRRDPVVKRHFVFAVLLCLLIVSAAWAQELATRMGNKEVVEMVGLGLSDDVIVEKIRTAPETKFDTSLEALKELKAAKVPDSVIKAMINPRAPAVVAAVAAPAPAAVVAKDPNLPPKEVGVYWKNVEKFIFIEGQMVSQAQIGGRAAHYFTYGVKSKHWNAYLSGKESRNKVKDNRPVFYFYVPEGNSANDYTLLKLDQKSDRRQFEVGSIGGWTGQKSGVREGNTKGFDAERVASRTYKVTLAQELPPGEYGFFMGTGQQMAMSDKEAGGSSQGRIYDFSISK